MLISVLGWVEGWFPLEGFMDGIAVGIILGHIPLPDPPQTKLGVANGGVGVVFPVLGWVDGFVEELAMNAVWRRVPSI